MDNDRKSETKKFPVEIVLIGAIFLPLVVIGLGTLILVWLDLSLAWLACLPVVGLAAAIWLAKRR